MAAAHATAAGTSSAGGSGKIENYPYDLSTIAVLRGERNSYEMRTREVCGCGCGCVYASVCVCRSGFQVGRLPSYVVSSAAYAAGGLLVPELRSSGAFARVGLQRDICLCMRISRLMYAPSRADNLCTTLAPKNRPRHSLFWGARGATSTSPRKVPPATSRAHRYAAAIQMSNVPSCRMGPRLWLCCF